MDHPKLCYIALWASPRASRVAPHPLRAEAFRLCWRASQPALSWQYLLRWVPIAIHFFTSLGLFMGFNGILMDFTNHQEDFMGFHEPSWVYFSWDFITEPTSGICSSTWGWMVMCRPMISNIAQLLLKSQVILVPYTFYVRLSLHRGVGTWLAAGSVWGVSWPWGYPNRWFPRENPMKMDDLGVPWGTPIYGNLHFEVAFRMHGFSAFFEIWKCDGRFYEWFFFAVCSQTASDGPPQTWTLSKFKDAMLQEINPKDGIMIQNWLKVFMALAQCTDLFFFLNTYFPSQP